ncbi:MAG: energy-coupling factor transporter transmembrane component T family protein [Candidatus Limnocylindria bacterium]
MNRFTPLRPDPAAILPRTNPMAKLLAAVILMVALFFARGPIIPAIVLGGLLGALPLSGLGPRSIFARTWPILIAAVTVGVFNVVLAPSGGGGPDLVGGLGLGLRLLGIAFAGVLALATTDPTDLADSLEQQAHLSPRLAFGVMAAVRMLPILAVEWQLLGMARRARGVSAGGSPVAAVRLTFGRLLTLLVGSVRRATRLALAMDARGFASLGCRTVARRQAMRPRDWWLVMASAALAVAAVGIGTAL